MNRGLVYHCQYKQTTKLFKGYTIFTYKQSDCSLVVYASSSYHNLIKKQLALYKSRWESIADKIAVTDNIDEIPRTSSIIIPTFMSYNINPLNYSRVTTIDAIQNLSIYDLRRALVEPTVHVTKDIDEARSWLQQLGPIFTYDCEATGLDVFNDELTMYSFAETEDEAIVIINESQEMEDLVMDFLTTTDSKVIIHNASFDMKIVKHRTGKFIKNFEDTQLLVRAYTNHADSEKAKTGLKHLAGKVYGDWATAKELFGIEHKYNQDLIHYSGVDACATMFLWNEYSTIDPVGEVKPFSELFPVLPPSEHEETPRFLYENILKPLVPSMIQLMLNGIPLDMEKVGKLETHLDDLLQQVKDDLLQNPLIKEFQKEQYLELREKQIKEYNSKKRDIRQYLKEYKDTDLVMRSFVVNTYLEDKELDYSFYPLAQLPNGDISWSVNDLKKFYKNNPTHSFITSVIDKSVSQSDPIVHKAMIALATYKTALYNEKYDEKIEAIDESILPEFNPGSSLQKTKLFEFLDIEPLAYSATSGAASWGRDQITEVMYSTSDENVKALCKTIIDYSQAAIIRNTFINAFNDYTIDGVLHGNIRIAGTKTYRPTSDKPNLLNLPSTGSIFAKPIKECMIAPPGKVIVAVDFGQLEDRVIANLTKDEGKCNIFLKELDSHCYNSLGYFKEDVAKHLTLTGDNVADTKAYKQAIDEGNEELEAIRQNGKPVTLTKR